ncbi:LysR family transcriptional regulator [Chimaeribacter coloradensis]|uniref:LysR family transcriptional regulator n=1 Tax=Chimaeribacter coloradensis TaxID=2060068 RepID=A0A2N5DXN9_9GAMM|nr:LysR substrate-binding domain-containing protein [Chimaeribacter coloradensis]PLR32203.1 LysR family transcriptional regulator [Chimaeribacter coloradensis]
MSRPLRPSLNALRAFEMTARKGGFTEAANALSVTHGAISRHIRALEELLGVTLLIRTPQGTKLTAEGAKLAAGLSRAFGMIQESIDDVRPRPLELSCSASIMMYWLLPRMGRLHSSFPTMEVGLRTGHGPIDFALDGVSVAIRLASIPPPFGITPVPLIEEWVGVVCAPDYLASSGIKEIADLERGRLLATRTRPDAWENWYRANNADFPSDSELEFYEHFYLLIKAAKVGLGFANTPRMLVREELEKGTLIAPFGFVKGPQKLVLWISPNAESREDTTHLVEWIRAEMEGN